MIFKQRTPFFRKETRPIVPTHFTVRSPSIYIELSAVLPASIKLVCGGLFQNRRAFLVYRPTALMYIAIEPYAPPAVLNI